MQLAANKQTRRPPTRSIAAELLNLHRGQGLDIYWRDNMHCPTEEQYNAMVPPAHFVGAPPRGAERARRPLYHRRASLNAQVLDKTGGLFRLSVKLMQAFSENKRRPPTHPPTHTHTHPPTHPPARPLRPTPRPSVASNSAPAESGRLQNGISRDRFWA